MHTLKTMSWNPGVKDRLLKMGVDPEVIELIESVEDPKMQGKLFNEVRKNLKITAGELEAFAGKLPRRREPTDAEVFVVRSVGDTTKPPERGQHGIVLNDLGEWMVINLMKHRQPDDPWNVNEERDINHYDHVRLLGRIRDWHEHQHPDLHNLTLDQAMSASDEWHKIISSGSRRVYQIGEKEGRIVYEFEDEGHLGWTMRTVESEHDLKVEGNLMGHCVGGYWDKVRSGRSRVFSLRDQKNAPHVTIELDGKKDNVIQVQGKEDKKPIKEYRKLAGEWLQHVGARIRFGEGENIEYHIMEREELEYAADPIWNYLRGEEEDIDAGNDYGIPMYEELHYSLPRDIFDTIIDKWETEAISEYSFRIGEFARRAKSGEWGPDIAFALKKLCEDGEHNTSYTEGDRQQYTLSLLIEAAIQYYGLYQMRDALPMIIKDFPKVKYNVPLWGQSDVEKLNDVANKFAERFGKPITSDNYESEYVPFAHEIVASLEPPFLLAKAVLDEFGYETFPFEPDQDAPGQQMLTFDGNPSFEMRPEMRHEMALEIAGGASFSAFQMTEQHLYRSLKSTDIQKNLFRYAKHLEGYRSVIDWLYVQTLGPKAWRECHQFYEGKGPQLTDLYTKEELERLDAVTLAAVCVLEDAMFSRPRWNAFLVNTVDRYSHLLRDPLNNPLNKRTWGMALMAAVDKLRADPQRFTDEAPVRAVLETLSEQGVDPEEIGAPVVNVLITSVIDAAATVDELLKGN